MTKQRLKFLFEKRLQTELTNGEFVEYQEFILDIKNEFILNAIISEYLIHPPEISLPNKKVETEILRRIISTDSQFKQPSRALFYLKKFSIAVIVLIILSISALHLYDINKNEKSNVDLYQRENDILPGKPGAILTLFSGKKILLDTINKKIRLQQGNTYLTFYNGELKYIGSSNKDKSTYNLITTPYGRTYSFYLQDGTHVYMNAGSSIKFPTSFSSNNRMIEMTGEIYYEVFKNKHAPFWVKIKNKGFIKVLGTHFNVNAYSDENGLDATLIQGSIKLFNEKKEFVNLQPGQQARLNAKGDFTVKKQVNISKIMSWRNGVFDFNDTPIEEVFKQISRWYDIEIVYKNGKKPDIQFYGQIDRSMTLKGLLRTLEMTGVHFNLINRKLIISS